MKITYALLLFLVFFLASCSKTEEEPQIYCDMVFHYIKLNWQDSDGEDLIFGKGAPYKIEDITFKLDYNGQIYNWEELHLQIDSTNKDNKSIIMMLSGAGSFILGNLPPDKLNYRTEYGKNVPCSSSLEELQLNDSVICKPCNVLNPIIIKK